MRRTDMVSGLVLACLGVLLLVWIIPAHTSPPQSESNLSPAFMPTVAASVLLTLALLLFVTARATSADRGDALHEEFGAETRGISARELGDIALWAGFAALMMVGFKTIGFVVTSVLALGVMMLYLGQRSYPMIALASLAVPIAIQQIAWYAFSVQMP